MLFTHIFFPTNKMDHLIVLNPRPTNKQIFIKLTLKHIFNTNNVSFLTPQIFFRWRPHFIDENGERTKKQNVVGEFGHNLLLRIMSKALYKLIEEEHLKYCTCFHSHIKLRITDTI